MPTERHTYRTIGWEDISTHLQCKLYQYEGSRLVLFSGPFASYTRKVYRKISYRLVFYFLPFTYLHRPVVSAQGCISYRRNTCTRLSVVNLSLWEVSRMRVRMRNLRLKLFTDMNFHEVSGEFSSPISALESSEHSTCQILKSYNKLFRALFTGFPTPSRPQLL